MSFECSKNVNWVRVRCEAGLTEQALGKIHTSCERVLSALLLLQGPHIARHSAPLLRPLHVIWSFASPRLHICFGFYKPEWQRHCLHLLSLQGAMICLSAQTLAVRAVRAARPAAPGACPLLWLPKPDSCGKLLNLMALPTSACK